MAKRTEERPGVGVPGLPPPLLPEPRRRRLGWVGPVAFVVLVAVAAVVVALTRQGGHAKPHNLPASSAPLSSPTSQGVQATTFEAFAALSAQQQQGVMQAAMDHYGIVYAQAERTLNPALLPQIATGDLLGVLQQNLATLMKNGYPLDEEGHATVLQVLMSPQPFSFVSVHVQSTDAGQYLDPKTLQPIGTPDPPTVSSSSFSFVIEGGQWKASEHIQDAKP